MKPISYEESKQLARHEDPKVRRDLATRSDLRPEILYYLAEDTSAEVRRAAAANAALPHQAALLLAGDDDQGVRESLAEKIAKLAPGLSAGEQDKLRQAAFAALETLARDQAIRVRQILAEALKDVAEAPPEVILQLARDVELVVCGPVLEFSPVLTDDDLLEIIRSGPVEGGMAAIARRAGLAEIVSDAVAASDDIGAIADLLANPSAQIREETLDSIIDRAVDIQPWHMPLVERPGIPSGCARKLARFVADNLLDILCKRRDLAPEDLEEVREVVRRRLEEPDADTEEGARHRREAYDPMEEVEELVARGELDTGTVLAALDKGNRLLVRAAIARLAEMPVEAIGRAFTRRDPEAIFAVAWKAGMEPTHAVDLQRRMANLPPRDVLEPDDGNSWPLAEEEMIAKLDMLEGT